MAINAARLTNCNDCRGTGIFPGEGGGDCPSCIGTGKRISDPHGAMQDILMANDALAVKLDAIIATQTLQGVEIDKIQHIKKTVNDIWDAVKP